MRKEDKTMKKSFEQPAIRFERFQITDAVMISGWMQFENEGGRDFGTLNTIATSEANNTRLG